ncbi:MFS transporter [Salinisphaera sp. Q1T1-3]|nr:MFS transporter [Salinisphaera sp. Q1T1-3]
MVVELALPAVLPGALVALHYGVQIARPRFGYGSDRAPRRSRWIVGGMAVLALGAIAAAGATWLMAHHVAVGIALAVIAFVAIGGGVGAAGTSLLALLARKVAPARRGAAAAVVWLMMILGIIVTAGVAGALLEPFSMPRLFLVATAISLVCWALSGLAVIGVEARTDVGAPRQPAVPGDFRRALSASWADPRARLFTVFVFVAMLAYSMQDLILEPFAGRAFGMSPGQTTQLTGLQHGGVLLGMLSVGALASGIGLPRVGTLRGWAVAGCGASALALVGLAMAAWSGPPWPLRPTVFVLGMANGGFAVAAIALMMGLAGGSSGPDGAGTRVGLWGAAQALAFGLGGLLGTVGVDTLGDLVARPYAAYAIVFIAQAVLFVAAALLMLRIKPETRSAAVPRPAGETS